MVRLDAEQQPQIAGRGSNPCGQTYLGDKDGLVVAPGKVGARRPAVEALRGGAARGQGGRLCQLAGLPHGELLCCAALGHAVVWSLTHNTRLYPRLHTPSPPTHSLSCRSHHAQRGSVGPQGLDGTGKLEVGACACGAAGSRESVPAKGCHAAASGASAGPAPGSAGTAGGQAGRPATQAGKHRQRARAAAAAHRCTSCLSARHSHLDPLRRAPPL